MRLTDAPCTLCGRLTVCTALWAPTSPDAPLFVRVPCCDACAAELGEDARAELTRAANELAAASSAIANRRHDQPRSH